MEGGKAEYVVLSWDQVYDTILKLSMEVRRSGFRPDVVVGISRGGWIPGRLLSDFLVDIRTASMGVEHYDGFTEKRKAPAVTQPLDENLEGKRVLLVDDIADTGESLRIALGHVVAKGAAEVRTLTIYYKPHSTLKPDYFAAETSDWIVFPWERLEMTALMIREKGRNAAKMALKHYGLKEKTVQSLLKLADNRKSQH